MNYLRVDTLKWIQLANWFITPTIVFVLWFFKIISENATSALVIFWLFAAIVLFVGTSAYEGVLAKINSGQQADFDDVLQDRIFTFASGVIAISIFLRVGYGILQWLKDGYWEKLTLCKELNLLCSANTEYLGVNKVIIAIGSLDFIGLLFVFVLGLGILYIAIKN